MKRILIVICLLSATSLFGQSGPPLLEEYSFQLGSSGGSELLFHDPSITGGAAQVRFHILPISKQETQMRIEIFRHNPPDLITFALLLERIEVQFLDSAGTTLKSVVIDEQLGESGLFIIGDSNDGYFEATRKLSAMGSVRGVRLRLFGNYE
jgi:hypothetical protein